MLSSEKPGKTLFLLKSKSKPVPSEKKRKKVPLLGPFEKYVEQSKKKSDTQIKEQPTGPNPASSLAPQGILQFMAPGPSAGKDTNPQGKGQKGQDAKMNTK